MSEEITSMSDRELLIRVHERLTEVREQTNKFGQWKDGLDESLGKKFVLRSEFRPIRALVYGFTALTLGAVLTSLIHTVVIAAAPQEPTYAQLSKEQGQR